MLVVIAENLPDAVRGKMKLWFIEPKPNVFVSSVADALVHNPEIFVREIQTLRTLVRHFHTGAILKSHTAVHIFSYENPEITYTEQEKY